MRKKKRQSIQAIRNEAIDLLQSTADISDGRYHENPLPGLIRDGKPIFAVGYVRVSTEDQGKRFSLGAQRDTLEAFGKRYNIVWVEPFFEDQCSAKSLNRPEWRSMLEVVKRRSEVNAIIAITPDRISRMFSDGSFVYDRLAQAGIAVVTCDTFSPTSSDFLPRTLLAVIAQTENMNRGKSVKGGIKKKRSLGLPHGKAPFGYHYVSENGYKVLQPHPSKSNTVKQIYKLARTTNLSLKGIRRQIVAGRFDTERLPQKVEVIIKNPIYKGEMRMDTRSDAPYVVPAKHKPLVTATEWKQANDRWCLRKTSRVQQNELMADVAITGLVRCSCGRKLYAMRKVHDLPSGLKQYSYLFCKTCKIYSRTKDIENDLKAVFNRLTFKSEHFHLFISLVQKHANDINKSVLDRIQVQTKAVQTIERKLERIQADYVAGNLPVDEYRQFASKLRADKIDSEIALETLQHELATVDVGSADCLSLLAQIGEIFEKGSTELQRQIIRTFFGEFHVGDPVVRNSVIDFIFTLEPAPIQEPDFKAGRNVNTTGTNGKKRRNKNHSRVKVWRNSSSNNNLRECHKSQTAPSDTVGRKSR